MTEGDSTVERHLRAAVDSSPSGLLMVDPDGRIVLVNREVERLFGYSREELLGRSVDLLVPKELREGHAGFRGNFLQDPKVRAMGVGRDLHGLTKDGDLVPVEIGLTPVPTERGMYVLSAIIDISERKRAEEERERLEAKLRDAQKMEAVGTLAGGIAHDFNNILTAILGYAELVQGTISNEQGRKDLNELVRFVERGKALVNRIQAFGRRSEAEKGPLSLERPLREVSEFLRSSLGPTIEIETRIAPDLPRVLGDASAIHQVLMNLGTNAAHAMTEGGRITLELAPLYLNDSEARNRPELGEGHHVLLSVTDTGAGIPEDVQERVFEPFFTTREPGTGTGLGLAIVHGIVREHDGTVELSSEVGSGTSVRVLLPAVEMDEVEEEAPPEAPKGNGERILYVEDEPGISEVARRRLEAIGYRVTLANDGHEALERLRADPSAFDALVTDYLMPSMNGLELAAAARELVPTLPILLHTGYADNLPDEKIRDSGVDAVIRKPATMNQLARHLRSVLARM